MEGVTDRDGFLLTMGACVLTVLLCGWNGLQGYGADWVYGFLAAFWSLLMMLRLMTLTETYEPSVKTGMLAQKIIRGLHEARAKNRNFILSCAFGGTFTVFLGLAFAYAGWQALCTLFPAHSADIDGVSSLIHGFGQTLDLGGLRAYDWAQMLMMVLFFAQMGFVIRSYAAQKNTVRTALLIFAVYGVSGYIAFAGLHVPHSSLAFQTSSGLMGQGAGAAEYFLAGFAAQTIHNGRTPNLFEMVLLEGGITGLALAALLLFLPLGAICMAAQRRSADTMIVWLGAMLGAILILAAFLPFSPLLGAFMVMLSMGLFWSWGACDHAMQMEWLDKRTKIEQTDD
jgi:hypothetical protein